MTEVSKKTPIQQFYNGTNVFLTGGTGFMGKVLIEKLLRTTDVETIYVLIREKKGVTPHMRVDSLFDDVIFDRVKSEKPKCRNRVEAISGDISIAGLGISITDRQKLINNINIVFHAAATVNFNENIKSAYNINVNGTKDLLNIAKQMTKLKSIIHISTAYSNCPRLDIDEKFYDSPYTCEEVETMIEKLTDEEAEAFTPKIIDRWPNTYTFTKFLAETLIQNNGTGLPLGVFRPSIVISTYQEPIPGWIDNIYGPTGLAVGVLSGVLRVAYANTSKIADIIPVDTCVNGLISAAWDTAERNSEKKIDNLPIYNYVSSAENPIHWDEFLQLNLIHGMGYTPTNSIWCPSVTATDVAWRYALLTFFLHIVPAAIMDFVSLLSGQKPKLLKMYKKVHKFSEVLTQFSTREWSFSNNNTQQLWSKLSKADQELYPFSMKHFSWTRYCRWYMRGVRKYLLKEPESTLNISQKRKERFEIAHRIIKTGFYFIINVLVALIIFKIFTELVALVR